MPTIDWEEPIKYKIYRELGKNISALRKKRKIHQTQLAEAVDMSRVSIANMELGRQAISIKVLYRIAICLDCEPTDLLPVIDVAPPKTEGFDVDRCRGIMRQMGAL